MVYNLFGKSNLNNMKFGIKGLVLLLSVLLFFASIVLYVMSDYAENGHTGQVLEYWSIASLIGGLIALVTAPKL